MNRSLAFVLFLLIVSGLSWSLGDSHAAARSRQEVHEAVRWQEEVDVALGADYALTAIPMIERGDTNAAIERLSRQIAVCYVGYASKPGTHEMRLRGKRVIEEMARTNQILATLFEKVAKGE